MRYFLLLFLAIDFRSIAQSSSVDSLEYDISKIYSLALDANLAAVLKIFQEQSSKPLTSRSQNIRDRFLKRFGYAHDSSDYLQMRNSSLNDILLVYRDYWRMSMLDPQAKYDSVLLKHLGKVLADRYKLSEPVERDTLEFYYKKAITDAGYYSTLFGKTGRLFDLLVWNHQYDTVYKFKIKKETIEAPVVFMEDFLTLGWGEYATLGRNHSGGWATRDTLFVVKKAYKLDSENFLVSYLAHEGKHFSDYKKFPKLSGIDLEYRSKLIELSLAKEGLYRIIDFFIKNSNEKSTNPHTAANYYVIRDLSRRLFNTDFESNTDKWKAAGSKRINKTAYSLYKRNSRQLKRAGAKTVSKYIK